MAGKLELHPDRLFPADPATRTIARALYATVADTPIVSPHGHTDPAWFATDEKWSDATNLLLSPDLVAINVHALTCSLGVPTRHLDLQFVARAPAGAQIVVSDESVDLRWWPIDALPEAAVVSYSLDPTACRPCSLFTVATAICPSACVWPLEKFAVMVPSAPMVNVPSYSPAA